MEGGEWSIFPIFFFFTRLHSMLMLHNIGNVESGEAGSFLVGSKCSTTML